MKTLVYLSLLFLMPLSSLAQNQVELEKRWGFIKPCITTKAEVEKILGNSITEDKANRWQTYDAENDRLHVIYNKVKGGGKTCGDNLPIDTVTQFFAYPADAIKVSELNNRFNQV